MAVEKKPKIKYGYKPSSVSLKGMTGQQLIEMMLSPAVRLFRIPFGERKGETVMARNVPWAGKTAGAKTNAEAMEMLDKVMTKAALDNLKSFGDAAASGVMGTTRVRYPSGVVSEIPTAAYERIAAGTNPKGIELA